MRNRNSVGHLIAQAVKKPGLVFPYIRRRLRNRRLWKTSETHTEFYRQVMDDDVAHKSPRGAVGTADEERWLAIGKKQFDYLSSHGLTPEHDLLEIGCGNLRAGWRFIEYLEPNRYYGIDISPDILIEANRTITERRLQARRPEIRLYDGYDLSFLAPASFDVAHAHSVFTHTPPDVVEAVLQGVASALRSGGFFDFTYNRSETGETWDFLAEDYYYTTDTLIEMAATAGFDARPAQGWSYSQEKIRATRL